MESKDKSEINDIIKAYIKTNEFKKLVATEVLKTASTSKELEKQVMLISTNMLIQLFKALWTKRSFWKDSLVNRNS